MSLNSLRVPISYTALPDKTLGYVTHILKHSDDIVGDLQKLSDDPNKSFIEALINRVQDLELCKQMTENSKTIQKTQAQQYTTLKKKLEIARNAIKKLESIPLLLNTRLTKINNNHEREKLVDEINTIIENQIDKAVEGLTDVEWSEKQEKIEKIYKSIPISPTDVYFEGKRVGDNDDNDEALLTSSIRPF